MLVLGGRGGGGCSTLLAAGRKVTFKCVRRKPVAAAFSCAGDECVEKLCLVRFEMLQQTRVPLSPPTAASPTFTAASVIWVTNYGSV